MARRVRNARGQNPLQGTSLSDQLASHYVAGVPRASEEGSERQRRVEWWSDKRGSRRERDHHCRYILAVLGTRVGCVASDTVPFNLMVRWRARLG